MQSKHYNFTSFLISFNAESSYTKQFPVIITPI